MRILSIRPYGGGTGSLARFDVELPTGIRIFSLDLKRAADGSYRVWGPHAFGGRVVTFPPNITAQISQAALAALGGNGQHDRTAA